MKLKLGTVTITKTGRYLPKDPRNRIRVQHDTGRVSEVRDPLPVECWAPLIAPDGSFAACVRFEVDLFGSEEGGDLRLGLTSYEVRAVDESGKAPAPPIETGGHYGPSATPRPLRLPRHEPLDVDLAGLRVNPKELLIAAALSLGVTVSAADRRGGPVTVMKKEAADYLTPGKATQAEGEPGKHEERQAHAKAWWDEALNPTPKGLPYAVAKARNEGSPGSEGARRRASVYIRNVLYKGGYLEDEGRALGKDLADYYRARPQKSSASS